MSANASVVLVQALVLAMAVLALQATAQGPRRHRPLRRIAGGPGPGPFRRALARTSSFGRRGYDGVVQSQQLDDPEAAWPAPPDQLQQLQPQPQPVQLQPQPQPVQLQPQPQPVQPVQLQPRIQLQPAQPEPRTQQQTLRQPTLPPLPSITFFLFTRDAPQSILLVGDDSTLWASGFNAARPTKVLIHGFTSSVNKTMMTTIKDAYLLTMDVNVVSVDWSPLSAAPWYPAARANVDVVGPRVADLLDWLAGHGLAPGAVHLVGHSLGAHVAGIAGARLRAGRVHRISGLDPARPGFRDVDLARRLDPTDAAMVDVIHTTAGFLGLEQPLGHMDFYPNGGVMSQPGCVTDIAGLCSHEKAFRIFRDSIGDVDFPAVGCDSMQSAMSGRCGGRAGVMGEHCAGTLPGIYFAVTR